MLLPQLRLHSLAMLGTLMTALFFVVRAVRQVSLGSGEHLLLQCCFLLLGLLSVGAGRGGSSFCLPF